MGGVWIEEGYGMNEMNRTMVDAIIKKAEALCPDSLALIGVYGSVITGDEYEKSDLDLMILINDEKGQVLADGFIIDDADIGYDLYCTNWDMLENDAQCDHAHLSKLFDSVIVYCKDKSALKRLDEIRRKAAELLASDRRYKKADQAYSNAKKMLAEVYLAQSLSKARSCAGAAIEFIENAVMLHNGRYFRKGTKSALDELKQLGLPFDLETRILAVIQAETMCILPLWIYCLYSGCSMRLQNISQWMALKLWINLTPKIWRRMWMSSIRL